MRWMDLNFLLVALGLLLGVVSLAFAVIGVAVTVAGIIDGRRGTRRVMKALMSADRHREVRGVPVLIRWPMAAWSAVPAPQEESEHPLVERPQRPRPKRPPFWRPGRPGRRPGEHPNCPDRPIPPGRPDYPFHVGDWRPQTTLPDGTTVEVRPEIAPHETRPGVTPVDPRSTDLARIIRR